MSIRSALGASARAGPAAGARARARSRQGRRRRRRIVRTACSATAPKLRGSRGVPDGRAALVAIVLASRGPALASPGLSASRRALAGSLREAAPDRRRAKIAAVGARRRGARTGTDAALGRGCSRQLLPAAVADQDSCRTGCSRSGCRCRRPLSRCAAQAAFTGSCADCAQLRAPAPPRLPAAHRAAPRPRPDPQSRDRKEARSSRSSRRLPGISGFSDFAAREAQPDDQDSAEGRRRPSSAPPGSAILAGSRPARPQRADRCEADAHRGGDRCRAGHRRAGSRTPRRSRSTCRCSGSFCPCCRSPSADASGQADRRGAAARVQALDRLRSESSVTRVVDDSSRSPLPHAAARRLRGSHWPSSWASTASWQTSRRARRSSGSHGHRREAPARCSRMVLHEGCGSRWSASDSDWRAPSRPASEEPSLRRRCTDLPTWPRLGATVERRVARESGARAPRGIGSIRRPPSRPVTGACAGVEKAG
jgi:hypothetical protein